MYNEHGIFARYKRFSHFFKKSAGLRLKDQGTGLFRLKLRRLTLKMAEIRKKAFAFPGNIV
ncbi:MAG TPA: hypothetical protein DC013_09140 [Ruminococcaceae bacterium]|nr:hypothetical protein [Oscillospiraceae bacterium]